MELIYSFVLLLASVGPTFGHVARNKPVARAETPQFPFDPNSSPYCSYWLDNSNSGLQCSQVPAQWTISMADFLRWNPSLAPNCANFTTGRSYCVEVTGEPAPAPTASTTTAPVPSTTTAPGNGIETPQPAQPGMVENCDAFYFVPKNSGCSAIAAANGITLAQFLAWNPLAGSTCGGLWAEAYACVSIVGHTPTTTTAAPPTATKPPNGITTPTPTQPDMVDNCDAFYFVPKNEICATIAQKNSITLAQFQAWNPQVGSSCGGLWADAYACVSIIGHTPTTPAPPNSVQTPTPIQSGMVTNCKTFHFVQEKQTCATIAALYKISSSDFIKWNPAAGSDCRGLWSGTYACVGLL